MCMKYYLTQTEEVLAAVHSNENGLSSAEAQKRLEENGKNKLKEAEKDSLLKKTIKALADPMIIMLLVAAAVSAGDILADFTAGHIERAAILPGSIYNHAAAVEFRSIAGNHASGHVERRNIPHKYAAAGAF